jgi:hypothetical protein
MLKIENGVILGNTGASDLYKDLLPWHDPSGVPIWILGPSDKVFVDEDGTPYHIRPRTLEEIQAMPLYQAWLNAQQMDAAQSQARIDFGTIPAWLKTYTAAQVEAYIETNVTTLATAKAALKIIAKIIVLMRDHTRFGGQ